MGRGILQNAYAAATTCNMHNKDYRPAVACEKVHAEIDLFTKSRLFLSKMNIILFTLCKKNSYGVDTFFIKSTFKL